MGRKLLTTALGAAGIASDVARHMAWFVSYHMGGTTQDVGRPSGR